MKRAFVMSRLFILELDVCDLLEHSNGCSSNRKMHCCERAKRRSSCVLLMDWVDKNAPNLFSNGPTNQCSFVVEVQLHHTWIYANSYRKNFKNNFCPQCCAALLLRDDQRKLHPLCYQPTCVWPETTNICVGAIDMSPKGPSCSNIVWLFSGRWCLGAAREGS